MKNKRYSDAQIMGILKQAESGVPVPKLYREHGMSSASFYKWRAKYGGMDASMISELKAMAEENRRLKRMYAERPLLMAVRSLCNRVNELIAYTEGQVPQGAPISLNTQRHPNQFGRLLTAYCVAMNKTTHTSPFHRHQCGSFYFQTKR